VYQLSSDMHHNLPAYMCLHNLQAENLMFSYSNIAERSKKDNCSVNLEDDFV